MNEAIKATISFLQARTEARRERKKEMVGAIITVNSALRSVNEGECAEVRRYGECEAIFLLRIEEVTGSNTWSVVLAHDELLQLAKILQETNTSPACRQA